MSDKWQNLHDNPPEAGREIILQMQNNTDWVLLFDDIDVQKLLEWKDKPEGDKS